MYIDKSKAYSTIETARLFNVTRRTIYRWIKNGDLPAYKLVGEWRVMGDDLEKFKRDGFLGGAC